jgi:uncharacterized membrane-anchored protein
MTSTQSASTIPVWRFWVPLLIQIALILSVPAQAVYTQLTGRTVVLQTVPVDPYDLLQGYSVALSYDISNLDTLRSLPGWDMLPKESNSSTFLAPETSFYVVLQAPPASGSRLPMPWKPIRISSTYPTSLPAAQVALRGQANYSSIQYGLETYYIPEDQREQINNEMNQIQQSRPGTRQEQSVVVEAKVDAKGQAVPVSIWVGDDNYRF